MKYYSLFPKLPEYIQYVIIVDDKSPTPLPRNDFGKTCTCQGNPIFFRKHHKLRVGGATKRGFEEAIAIGAEIIIKVDADDQMDLSYLPNLLDPLIANKCDVAKGNRFKDLKALRAMPIVRRIGNLGLSFLIKSATGYWHNFDPTNGFLALKPMF